MEIVGTIFSSIAIIYSLFVSQCSKKFFEYPEQFQNFSEEVNLCEIIRNSQNFPQELRDEILNGQSQCTFNFTTSECNEIFRDGKKDFNQKIDSTIKSFYQDEIEMTLPHEKCIYDTFDELKLVNAYFKLFLDPDVIFKNETGNEIEMLSTAVRAVRSYCNADELYEEKFDSHRHDVKNLSDLEPCNVQYLIDRRFVKGNLSEQPKDCKDKDFLFEKFLSSTFLFRNYGLISNFYSSEKFEIQKCFLDKTIELQLPHKLVGIGYSYAIRATDYNIEDEKKNFVELMKLMDKTFIECLTL